MLWLKAFHLIAVICWFAQLFYLPRLFVYHAMSEDSISNERFKVMERKLYRGIGLPSMILTFVFGIWMIALAHNYYLSQGWIHIKLTLVLLLVGYQHMCGRMVRAFAQDRNTRSHRFYRWFNEAPVVLLIAIVLLAVLKQPS